MATSTADRRAPSGRMPKFQRNAQARFDCPAPNCTMVGHYGSKSIAGLHQHMRKEHGYRAKDAAEAYAEYLKLHPEAATTQQPTEQAESTNGDGKHGTATKRRNTSALAKQKPIMLELPFDRDMRVNAATNAVATVDKCLNYCPRCGHDLDKIRQATGGFPAEQCPSCKLNLVTTRMALAPSLIDLDPKQVAHVFGVMFKLVHGGNGHA
jgi:hypothetical protein